jgi:hypothetical protein
MCTEAEALERLVGVWRLLDWTAIFADGHVKPPFGPGAIWQLLYTLKVS